MSDVHGHCERRFAAVRDAFEENFRKRDEHGAACSVFHRGERVVDLWGGYADRRGQRRWRSDTLAPIFSVGKGVAATIVAQRLSEGRCHLDSPVASYWPEFAQRGKQRITVRDLLGHRAGLSVIPRRTGPSDIGDLDRLAERLAAMAPAWDPGVFHGYHGITLGWYQNELHRRVDEARSTIGERLASMRELLEEELYIGGIGAEGMQGPTGAPTPDRVADLLPFSTWRFLVDHDGYTSGFLLRLLWPLSLAHRSLALAGLRSAADLAEPEFQRVEIPSANGIATARGLARMYGLLAIGGERLGLTAPVFDELASPSTAPPGGLRDRVLRVDTAYQLGFFKPNPRSRFGTSDAAFGSPGAGGSMAYADPDSEIGFAYVTNRLGTYLHDDPREVALRQATHASEGASVSRETR